MGAWDTAIFTDDTAADVRDDFIDLIGEGLAAEAATARIVEEWNPDSDPEEEGAAFWLGLAAIQWKLGRLLPDVRDRALGIINSGQDLSRWRLAEDVEKRRKVLEQLGTKLLSPQPQPKRVPRRFRATNDWNVGSLHSYALGEKAFCLLRVIGHHVDKGGKFPVVELLDWMGGEIPPVGVLGSLPIRIRTYPNGRRASQFMLGAASLKDFPGGRIRNLGVSSLPSQSVGAYYVFLWRNLDRQLADVFGMRARAS